MQAPALPWYLRDVPHRHLVCMCVHGVVHGDTLPLHTAIVPNLLSLCNVPGGADAVAREVDVLRARGWYAGAKGAAPALPSSPVRICPRGAVPRKDGGPPRGVAEEGWPRQETVTADNKEPVDSLNNSSCKRRGLPPHPFWVDESKPTLGDAALNTFVLTQ
eukprot:6205790-Pleurochrysis_carterae.AAC.1